MKDGQFIRYELRPTGIREVRWSESESREVEREPVVEKYVLTVKLKDKHREVLSNLWAMARAAEESGRSVAILQSEAISVGMDKGVLKYLERHGILGSKIVELAVGGKKIGGRKAVYLTAQGRSLLGV